MSDHIPSPWKWSKARKSSNFGNYTVFIQAPVPGNRPFIVTIAKVLGGPEDKPEFAEAHGRLLAAAPNLLDSIRELLWLFDQPRDPDEGDSTRIIREAKAAFTKATGEPI